MKKVIMTYALPEVGMEILKDKVDVIITNEGDPNKFIDKMKEVNGIIIKLGTMPKSAIENATHLEFISLVSAGFDHVDVDTATKYGIPVLVSAGANARSVAEHTIGLLIAVNRKIVPGHFATVSGVGWHDKDPDKSFELYDKTIGIIGLGSIGRLVGKIAEGLGMKVIGYDPFITKAEVEKLGWTYYSDYNDMIKIADVITVHVPRLPETIDLITMKHLKLMKKTAIVLNTARGGIINENDLADALNQEIIAGAGIDVYETEPVPSDAKILHAKNIVHTPHCAAMTREAIKNTGIMCAKGALAVLNGEKWSYVADPKAYDHPRWKK
jgi:D-3-phosphoglycerate dehydrogenase